jgi:hypothetical protein
MLHDFGEGLKFNFATNTVFQTASALNGRIDFFLKPNPERQILHTVQVERNGFIHALLCGTSFENMGYEYYGPRAYTNFVTRNSP